jgi:hypothetical protein
MERWATTQHGHYVNRLEKLEKMRERRAGEKDITATGKSGAAAGTGAQNARRSKPAAGPGNAPAGDTQAVVQAAPAAPRGVLTMLRSLVPGRS